MNEHVEVRLDFINKKGDLKHVKFYMNKQTYEMLNDESVSEEKRHQYLVEEYHEYERERYYNRKFSCFDYEMVEVLNLVEETSISNEDRCEKEFENNKIIGAISKLTPRQQEMIKLLYWEGKSQKELCEIYGVKKQAISDAVKRIHNSLRKKLEKK